jgi:hypothetical protein
MGQFLESANNNKVKDKYSDRQTGVDKGNAWTLEGLKSLRQHGRVGKYW